MDNLVISNILHRRTRSAITAAGVAIGVTLIILVVGLVDGFLFTQARRNSAITAEIIFAPPTATFGFGFSSSLSATMPSATASALRQVDGVARAAPILQHLDGGSRLIDGIDYDSLTQVSSARVIEGRPMMSGDEVIVDRRAQQALKLHVGDNFTLLGRPFRVVGIYEPESLARFKIPLSTMQQSLNRPGACSGILVKTAEGQQPEDLYRRLAQRFPDNKLTLTRDLPALFARGTPAMGVFEDLVIALAIVVSGILILLTMYSTVKERTRQIGILKALGASKAWIAAEIEKEALAICAAGTLGGYALAVAGKYLIQGLMPTMVELEARWFFYALALALVSGAVGALYPAWHAARQDPVSAIAYE